MITITCVIESLALSLDVTKIDRLANCELVANFLQRYLVLVL